MYSSGTFCTPAEEVAFSSAVASLGTAFFVLRNLSEGAGECMWQIKPKIHATMHLPYENELISPQAMQNYNEESLMGVVTKTWKASCSGPFRAGITKITLIKRMVVWLLDMEV